MKRIRLALALLLSLAAILIGSAALADFDDVPSFSMTAPEEAVISGSEFYITVTAKMPGFLAIDLLDAAGDAIELRGMAEVHTKDNEVTLVAVDEENVPLAAGDYTLSAVLTSQWGVSSSAVTAPLSIAERVVEEEEEEEEEEAEEEEETEEETEEEAEPETKDEEPAKDDGKKAKATPKPTKAPKVTATPVPEVVTYVTGTTSAGEEGYEIGVGVGDVAEQTDAGYWALTADASDEEIWAAIIRPLTGVNVGEKESSYIYDSPKDGRKRIGTVSGISHGLNVIAQRDDGWSLVETFRNEDGAFIRGYIRTNRLRTSTPNQIYGVVIDKAAQKLTIYKEGVRIGSCDITTGLPTPKYLHRETPAGEYILMTRRGTTEYYGKGFSEYSIRFSGDYHISEIPTTKRDGSDFSLLADSLGKKATRGNICITNTPSGDGGINAEWFWNMTTGNKSIKVLILDDKARDQVPVGIK